MDNMINNLSSFLIEFSDFISLHPMFLTGVVLSLSLVVGSFLNVVILRYPIMLFRSWLLDSKEMINEMPSHDALKDLDSPYTLSTPASHCPVCSSKVKPWQNIPVLSYALLRGKCSSCSTKISLRYPIIEIATALLTTAVLLEYQWSIQLGAMLIFTWILITLTVIDFDHQILPDSMTFSLLWLGLLLNVNGTFVDLESAVLGAVAGYLYLWFYFWVFKIVTGKDGVGYGDFKLLAAIGAWFGWVVLPALLFIAFLLSAVLMLVMGTKRNTPIPFGPSLAASGWIVAMWFDEIIEGWHVFLAL
jgi:leader peptidase (prepilin peptidase)/N-methyltransferase